MYRARDTKLDRDVALKVLPQAFTDDPDRLARFEREAKVLASLNHPNIGHIYGLEEAEGQKALVLELVEGPTLAERIKQGPIPVDEALPIAKQIAEALEAAHEQGIIHRDLKPANIKLTPKGRVKVLDFGLARSVGRQISSDDETQVSALTQAMKSHPRLTGRGPSDHQGGHSTCATPRSACSAAITARIGAGVACTASSRAASSRVRRSAMWSTSWR